MTARGGRVNSSTDWDPMREDYNDTSYDAQYQENDNSCRSTQSHPLDHRKLYITNLPTGLNEQGLKSAFEKYGQVEQAFLSRDPMKKYALIRYETAAEARIAMMKLNRTEPLNLHVYLAHAKGNNNEGQNGTRDRGRKDSGSYASSNKDKRSRNQDEIINSEEEIPGDSMGIDHNFHLELEKIKLDKLRVQEEQLKCRHKMMLLQLQRRPNNSNTSTTAGGSSRRLLPDGRVIVQERVPDADPSFTAGAGDSLNIPGLQRVTQRKCIVCGANADTYCARCLVTPYCSTQCQRRDWTTRHNSVCHNLVRLQSGDNVSPKEFVDDNLNIEIPSPPAPLRRPRSPISTRNQPQRTAQNNAKGSGEQRGRGQSTHFNSNNKTRFVPPDHHPQPSRAPRSVGNPRSRSGADEHHPKQSQDNDNEEDWGNEKKTPEHKATPKPQNKSIAPKPQAQSTPTPEVSTFESTKKPTAAKSEPFKPNARMGANLSPETQEQVSRAPTDVAIVPSQYLIEKLPIGDTFVLSVEQPAKDCASNQQGFVCLAMHADFQEQFSALLGDICDGERLIQPKPGVTFAYLDESDGGWYRARFLSSTRCALLDASRVANISSKDQCRALARQYADIPEFCCVLNGKAEVSMSLKCTILMKTAERFKVSIDASTEDAYLGEGIVSRWKPEVENGAASQPAKIQTNQEKVKPPPTIEKAKSQPEKAQPQPEKAQPQAEKMPQLTKTTSIQIPSVKRPAVVNNGRYLLMHVTSLGRACIRSSDAAASAEFESVLQDTALYGVQNAKRLTEPPVPGQVVLSYYEEVHYRALVKRTKASDNRYKVEYVEYGNEEIVPLEKLFACPAELDLSSRPALASIVALSDFATAELTQPANDYVDTLKEEAELIATTPGGEKSVPSGSLVLLSLAKNKVSVNKKLEAMCTPEWKKLEEGGGDVIESEVILFPDMKTLPLPTTRPFVMDITDFTNLETGVVCGFETGAKEAEHVYGPLTDQINEYCNSELCSEPYLPMVEELCIARLQPYPQWFRAVVVEHRPGAATAAVLYTDYGNVEGEVPVADLRKCMPEFARDPALAATADIKDWPKTITSQQLVRALEFLNVNDEGRGQLPVKRCKRIEDDLGYVIEVPDLIAAINSV